ncbi:hypothetical protein HDU76_006075 [Blyttiomyces sp. JEL0837]|nr:hypothetical protein HDU76_006075 [Blyttiomyces sp. JEL0837]
MEPSSLLCSNNTTAATTMSNTKKRSHSIDSDPLLATDNDRVVVDRHEKKIRHYKTTTESLDIVDDNGSALRNHDHLAPDTHIHDTNIANSTKVPLITPATPPPTLPSFTSANSSTFIQSQSQSLPLHTQESTTEIDADHEVHKQPTPDNNINPPPPTPTFFKHQVAGHPDSLVTLDSSKYLAKPTSSSKIEQLFYENAVTSTLYPWIPQYHDTITIMMPTNAGKPKSEMQKIENSNVKEEVTMMPTLCIKIENLLYGFDHPCIIDVKIGTRLYGDDADMEKRKRMEEQAEITTSGKVGLRICGMKVFNTDTKEYDIRGREYGRSLTEENIIDGFRKFFNPPSSSSSKPATLNVLNSVKDQLLQLRDAVSKTHCRLYASSLLIVYEAPTTSTDLEIGGTTLLRDSEDGPKASMPISTTNQKHNPTSSLSKESEESAIYNSTRPTTSKRKRDNANDDGDDDLTERPPKSPKLDNDNISQSTLPTPKTLVRLIDFAHSHFEDGIGPDDGALFGLDNLIRYLYVLVDELK